MTVRNCCDNTVRAKCTYTSIKVLKRAIRKCLSVMRQKLTINKKMLSVVSAGAAAGMGGMDRLRGGGGRAARELAASRDRQVRLHTVRTDIKVGLPTNIALPDGEHDHPCSNPASQRFLHLRDPEQESEIYQKCIRAPPNRTVLESESPPPYRSSSAGVLPSFSSSASSSSSSTSSTAGSDWSTGSAPLVVRCHSMSSTSARPASTSSGSTMHHQPAQKTDFLQRTVKIFTGGGKKAHTQPPPPAPTLPPVVVVPHRPQRKPDNSRPSTHRPHSPV